MPIISYSFTSDGGDYLDDAMNLLNAYLIKCDNLSPQIWFFYPIIIYHIIGLNKSVNKIKLPEIVEYQN